MMLRPLLILIVGTVGLLAFSYWPDGSRSGQVYADESPHHAYTLLTGKCAACHRVHTPPGTRLRREWPEEALCLMCHDGTGAYTDLTVVFGQSSKHPIFSQAGSHAPRESGGAAFANRHVECEDCHNPHRSTGAGASAPNVRGPITGASGISVDNGSSPGTPGSYTWVSRVSREYELCFKCHSSYTTGYTGTDKAADFNTNNPSYHPIEAAGKNPGIDVAAFVPPWSSSSLVYCSDCHSDDHLGLAPEGPHGSAHAPILKKKFAQTVYWTSDPQDELSLCFDCHASAVYYGGNYGSRFSKHKKHVQNKKISCYACHESHGRSDTVHLIRVTPDGPVTSFDHDPINDSLCYATCHRGHMGQSDEDYSHRY